MLHFATQPPSRPALRSIKGGKNAAPDTPEKTLSACLKAGVDLRVTGVEDEPVSDPYASYDPEDEGAGE